METSIIQQSVKQISPSSTDRETVGEWLLTAEEEKAAIDYAIVQKSKQFHNIDETERLKKALVFYDDAEIKKLLYTCNENKRQNLWHQKQAKHRKEQEQLHYQALLKNCDANYFFNLIKSNANKKLILNGNTKSYIKTICFFFGNDERFITELNLDFSKGLWIRGAAGLGKTFILNCIQNNELAPFNIHSMLAIASEVSGTGDYEIKEFLKVIDDVGSEQSIVNHYGTKINWFKDFIELYYTENKPFNQLIVTTNFDFDNIEKNYGFRVRSRIKDMFNIIDVTGEDLRG